MEDNKNTLGGFEAFLDDFIPNPDGTPRVPNTDDNESMDDDDLDDILKNQDDPVAKKVKKTVEEPVDDDIDDNDDDDDSIIEEPKRKPGRPKKEEPIEEPVEEDDDSEVVTNFFDAMSEELGWEFGEDDEKPKSVPELINYFKTVIEENSKPDFASEEIEALDAYVKQGGDLKKYLQIDAELDLDDIDLDEESNQKAVVKMWLKEKGFSAKQIEKKISKYEDAGLLEDEAEDAIEDLKEIREQRKEQLLKEQERLTSNIRNSNVPFILTLLTKLKA